MALTFMNSQLTVIQPSGHVNAANAVEFQQQLTTAVSSGERPVLVDMHRVESIDSAGLMALVSAFRLAQSRKQRFGLCCLAPSIRIIFELTQLDEAFEIFESRDAFTATLEQKIIDKALEDLAASSLRSGMLIA
ncbi:MAG: anti-sigma factor antagonist [Symplocastrum torsivum CPER-KK1]|jgi:anti-anti-sigma factor|uniref:Anti-sigma factor antagonist n=1 Tax=Symplocastrum torsivum CPER-KK1 TaxID=450513 RepID=A0A951PML1_9CYAN|nr:STAS domain-containing protein [Microcoleus sp. FACHB-SPT15]MBD1804851.1 STAS domain-containing protein [Microcoleus sp. FACHB-SPT15]MBW4546108.1 anti-sigma factor antagonist [Symplocastrum torsivum CPER-KK1]